METKVTITLTATLKDIFLILVAISGLL